jgi:hypothetical protein
VGFSDVRLGDLRVAETIRLPVDLLDRVAARLDDHPLDIVMTRLRAGSQREGRADEEPVLDRTFELPTAQSFEVRGTAGLDQPAGPEPQATAPALPCDTGILEVDGEPLPVVAQPLPGGRALLAACDGPLVLGPGAHRIRAVGPALGLDVDRVVLSTEPLGSNETGPPIEVAEHRPGRVEATVEARGEPFWFVLGESANEGWRLEVEGGTPGDRQLVDGFANGWLVSPSSDGPVRVTARWTPQRLVPIGYVISALTIVACLLLVLRSRRRDTPVLADRPTLSLRSDDAALPLPWGMGAALGIGLLALAVASPSVAAATVVATLAVALAPRARSAALVAAPAALAVSRFDQRPQLAWLAVALLVAVVVTDGLRPIREPASP